MEEIVCVCDRDGGHGRSSSNEERQASKRWRITKCATEQQC